MLNCYFLERCPASSSSKRSFWPLCRSQYLEQVPPQHPLAQPAPSSERGMEVEELCFTAAAGRTSHDGVAQALSYKKWLPDDSFLKDLQATCPGLEIVFSSSGDMEAIVSEMDHSRDHLAESGASLMFMSLIHQGFIRGMLVLYEPLQRPEPLLPQQPQQRLHVLLAFGTPVCGHPAIVHGGLISAIFDEAFGALLWTAKALGHMEAGKVFTARLEVDYKKPLPSESVIRCSTEVESIQGRKIWLTARITDVQGELVYASSKALFVAAKAPAAA